MFIERKARAPLSAGASVDHGVEVGTTGEHVNKRLVGVVMARLVVHL
jgi:hypothetical protein